MSEDFDITKIPARLLNRYGITFSMVYYLLFEAANAMALNLNCIDSGLHNDNDILALLLSGSKIEYDNTNNKNRICPIAVFSRTNDYKSGKRPVPKYLLEQHIKTKSYTDIAKDHLKKHFNMSNKHTICNAFYLLFKNVPSLLSDEYTEELNNLKDDSAQSIDHASLYIAAVLKFSLINTQIDYQFVSDGVKKQLDVDPEFTNQKPTSSIENRIRKAAELTENEKTYLSGIYNEAKKENKTILCEDKILKLDPSIHFASDVSEHEMMWQAGKRWYEHSKSEGERFENLHINKKIFPRVQKKIQSPQPYNVVVQPVAIDANSKDKLPLKDAITHALEQNTHVFLIGEGGIGKTTALYRIMKETYECSYDENNAVPLFIDLSAAPDIPEMLYDGGISSFIIRSIYKQLIDNCKEQVTTRSRRGSRKLDDAFTKDPTIAVDPIWEILSKTTKEKYEYLLLLDGLNECSRAVIEDEQGRYSKQSVVNMVMSEISDIAQNCPNVRIILTGRADENAVISNDISRFNLCGVDTDTIEQHLLSCKWSEEQVSVVLKNEKLVETLRIPLFLSLFTDLPNRHNEILTRGELLRIYFHERTLDSVYTSQNRAHEITKGLIATVHAEPRRISADIQYFLLDFVLPEIAFYMVKNGLFSISPLDVQDVLEVLFADCTTNGSIQYAFQQYRRQQYGKNTPAMLVKKLQDIFGVGMVYTQIGIIELATSMLGILMMDDGDNYRFLHHHIRDYFASRKVVNTMLLAEYLNKKNRQDKAIACLTQVIGDKPLDYTLRELIGEILGEHRNAPQCIDRCWRYWTSLVSDDEKLYRGLIEEMLDVCRGVQGDEIGYTIYNLLQILKEIRKDLSGLCFDKLDIRNCSLNAVPLSKPGLPATFVEALLDRETLFSAGHTRLIRSVASHPDKTKECILTASLDGKAKVWDYITGRCLKTLDGHSDSIMKAVYAPSGDIIVTASRDHTAKVWQAKEAGDIVSFLCTDTLTGHSAAVTDVAISPDGKTIATASEDCTVRLWVFDDGKYRCVNQFTHQHKVFSVAFHPLENRLLTLSKWSIVTIWDIDVNTHFEIPMKKDPYFSSAEYSPDGQQILLSSALGGLGFGDVLDAVSYQSLTNHAFDQIRYSPDGKSYLLLTGAKPTTISIYEASTRRKILDFSVSRQIRDICFGKDFKYIFVAHDASVSVYETTTGCYVKSLHGLLSVTPTAVYNMDGKELIASYHDGTAKIWDTEKVICKGVLHGHKDIVYSAIYNPITEKNTAVTVSRDAVREWDIKTLECRNIIPCISPGSTVYSEDGEHLFIADKEHIIVKTNKGCFVSPELVDRYLCFALCRPDPHKCLTPEEDPIFLTCTYSGITVWNSIFLPQHSLDISANRRGGYFSSAAYSPDGSMILTTQTDGTVDLWSADLKLHYDSLQTIDHLAQISVMGVFNHAGTCVAVAPAGEPIRFFEITPDRSLVECRSPIMDPTDEIVFSAAFSPDDKQLLISCRDGAIKAFNIQTCKCLFEIINVPGLYIQGVDLSKAKLDLSPDDKKNLQMYGALM